MKKKKSATIKAKDNAHFKILIVEDEAISAMMLSSCLRNAGYTVLEVVQTGEKALGILEKVTPDLILMDIILEGKNDGITTMEMINKKKKIPVIYSTGNSDHETMKRIMATDPVAVIIKPINKEELLRIVQTLRAGS